jgi:hypothetical protein
MSKLLWTLHKNKTLPLINADNADCKESPKALGSNTANPAANEREKARIVLVLPRFRAEKAELATIGRVDEDTGAQISLEERGNRDRGYGHGPPELRAA